MNANLLSRRIAKRLRSGLSSLWFDDCTDSQFPTPGDFAEEVSGGRWQMARHHAYLNREFMRAIDDARAGLLDVLLVSMPPQHGKSEFLSKYAPAWFLGEYPDLRVILTSYEAEFAASWGGKVRDLLQEHGHRFGVKVSSRSSATDRWDIEGHDGGMNTAGAGGAITGKGADLFIIDDPIKNDEQARSATIRNKQWGWYQSTASTRLRPGAMTIVIQTRWHRDDLTGRILANAKESGIRVRSVVLPAIAKENDPLGREPGEALWPEKYPLEILERRRSALTPYYWESIYQQNPLAEGGAEWPDSVFGDDIWFNEWPQDVHCRVLALDPSKGKDAKYGDYSAFVLAAFGHDGIFYVDADLAIRDVSLICEQALEINSAFRPDRVAIESNQFQQLLVDNIRALAAQRGAVIPVTEVDNRVNKLVRIRRLTPFLTRGLMRFKGGSAGAKLLVEQLRDFPNGDHDDGPDALEMALRTTGTLLDDRNNDDPLAGLDHIPIGY